MIVIKVLAFSLFITLLSLAFIHKAESQEVQCVEVPPLHKIVFVPIHMPVDELFWKWNKAKEPPQPEPVECDGRLVISPGSCDN